LSNVLLPVRLPMSAEYWTGTAFTTNSDDSCTALLPANVGYSGYAGKLQLGEVGAPTIATDPSSGGKWWIVVPKPAGGDGMYEGSVLVTPDLSGAGMSYLKGNWSGIPYTTDPSARAAFGVYGAQPRNFIFFREIY
jgi:MSHA biogenesis protein MshQ